MNIPTHLRYLKTHEWARMDTEEVIVGITDYAQHELTDIVFIELPSVGKKVEAQDPVCVIESVKVASDIYAPVAGVVTRVNEQLANDPGMVNRSPYDEGWLFAIRPNNPADIDKLLDSDSYQGTISQH